MKDKQREDGQRKGAKAQRRNDENSPILPRAARSHSVSVWRPAGTKLPRRTHVSTPQGSATRTKKAVQSLSTFP